MQLKTKHFGEVEVDESKVLTFAEGLPGFPDAKEFIILKEEETEENDGLICWLQAIKDSNLAFVLMNVFKLMAYEPLFDEEELAALGENPEEDYLIYNIAVIPDDIKNTRVNLRAPLVINTFTQKGKQIVASNEGYAIKHYLFAQTPEEM